MGRGGSLCLDAPSSSLEKETVNKLSHSQSYSEKAMAQGSSPRKWWLQVTSLTYYARLRVCSASLMSAASSEIISSS
jgi:hypothetical protein